MKRIEVVDYDPTWPAVYETLVGRVWPAVSDLATSIEHVGSTAVPGLAAKPVIDLDVIVEPPRLGEAIARLAEQKNFELVEYYKWKPVDEQALGDAPAQVAVAAGDQRARHRLSPRPRDL